MEVSENLPHGGSNFMASNDRHPKFYAVSDALHIISRATYLYLHRHMPLAIYYNMIGKACLLPTKHMAYLLRVATKDVYKITSTQPLQCFSYNSLRVGACIRMHCAHFSYAEIQFKLCWRSDFIKNLPTQCPAHRGNKKIYSS